MARQRIGELLVSAKVLSEEQLQKALATPRAEGQRLGGLLVQLGMVTETQLTQVLGQQLSVPWVSLYHIDFSRQLLNLVPHDVAEKYCLVPIFVRRVKKQDTLYVAMDDPTNEMALNEVAAHAGLPVKPMIASPSDIRSAIGVYYGTGEASAATSGVMAAAQPASVPNQPAAAPAAPPKKPPSTPGGGVEVRAEGVAAKPAKPPSPRAMPAAAPARSASASGDSPDASPEIEAREVTIPRPKRGGLPMVALTLLDGSTIHLPARRAKKEPEPEPAGTKLGEALTARDIIRALRAVDEGANAKDLLGEDVKWEPLFAALLQALLKKGVIADWDFIEELRALTKPQK